MRIAIVALAVCCGCLCTESLKVSQACISSHAQKQATAVQRIAELSTESPVSDEQALLLRELFDSSNAVTRWTDLTQSHLGRAEAPPAILTPAEIEAQGLYKSQIELQRSLYEGVLRAPAAGGGLNLFGAAGGGVLGIVTCILGLLYRSESRMVKKLRAATGQAIDVIAGCPDEAKKKAAAQPDLVEVYADRKASEYELRVNTLKKGASA